MELVSKHITVKTEYLWNYRYETVEEYNAHREEMKKAGALVETSFKRKDGKVSATYIKDVYTEVPFN